MAQVTVKVGSGSLTLNETSDLARLATGAINLGIIGDAANSDATLQERVDQVTQFSIQPKISLQESGSWAAAGQASPLTLSIQAGVSGTLSLIQPGKELFKYPPDITGDPQTSQLAKNGGVNCPYLCIGFSVNYSVQGGAKFSFGALGVNGDASKGATFSIDNYFACDPSAKLIDCIKEALNSFVMPFSPDSASSMPDGSFLDYNFSGKVAFDVGLSYGLSIAGKGLSEIKSSFSNPVASGKIAPTLKLGASLGLTFEADDTYRVIVGRQNSTTGNLVNLSVSKIDKTSFGINAGVQFTASLGASFNFQETLNQVIAKAAAPLLKDIPANLQNQVLASFTNSLGAGQLEQFQKQAQDKINSWIAKINNETAGFTVAWERDRTNTQLCSCVIDCSEPEALRKGYPAAIQCDFKTALQAKGVELQPGSFLEQQLGSFTTLTLQFFNLFKATDTVKFFQDLKTVYAGQGVFRVVYQVGEDWITTFNKKSEDLKVFFQASATTGDLATFRTATLSMNFVMKDQKNRKGAAITATVLEALNNDSLMNYAERITDTVTVTTDIDAQVLSQLRFDPVKVGRKLNPGSHDNDRRNYEMFAAKVNIVRPDNPFANGRYASYADWCVYNACANDQPGSTQPPDRSNSGNLVVESVWPPQWPVSDNAARMFISIDLEAGRQFMNLCEYLDTLDNWTLSETLTDQAFENLTASLASAVHANGLALSWYSRATFLALVALLLAKIDNVKGTDPGTPISISFDLLSDAAFSASIASRTS